MDAEVGRLHSGIRCRSEVADGTEAEKFGVGLQRICERNNSMTRMFLLITMLVATLSVRAEELVLFRASTAGDAAWVWDTAAIS